MSIDLPMSDEAWEDFWAEKEPEETHDEYCTQEPCTCLLIRLVMERETMKLTNLRGYVIMTTERYEELVNRPEVPF